MLRDSLFKILSLDQHEHTTNAVLELNAANDIFKGHFPGQPVLPGACMLQMLKEILETGIGQSLVLKKAASMKFISMVDPAVNNTLRLNINYSSADDELKVTASMLLGDVVCFKFQGLFGLL